MKTRFVFLTSLLLLTGLWSCTNFHKKERLNKIDSIAKDLSEMNEQLSTMTLDTIELRSQLDTLFYKVYQIEDTISLDFMYKIDSLRQWNEQLEERNAILNKLQLDLPESMTRLDDLEKDIEMDFGKREKYDSYIHNEELGRDNLQLFFKRFSELQSALENDFTKFGQSFLEELNLHAKKEQ